MSDDDFPALTEAVVAALEKQFRDRLPTSEVTPWELGRLAGEQRVVKFLRSTLERQNENPLDNVPS